ncbi:DUF6264 family protein [Nocardiopsis sp. MG754419]|uniref:DUF6264 family protein n=1 Tax=Nocardiopsis sp. MG754419 TaxID=2259865 RepID=UPI001BAA8618|nr:DUF6264 family protein [Nocardiopsis sp. MG754419]MBR8742566.1 hypothetical protein [Nocardiopsis sp. MG754419]
MHDDRNPGLPGDDNSGGYGGHTPYGGQGYGPPPPSPYQGPYQDPYQDPYQAHQQGYPPQQPMYPAYPVFPPALNKGGAIGALVTSILLVISCYGFFAVIGLIFSIIAVSETYDQEKVSRFTRYAWIANAVVIGLLVLFFGFIITMIIVDS